jgi:hypothetical protein
MTSNMKRRTKDYAKSETNKKEVPAYKYSKRGQRILHEAIILSGERQFVAWYGENGPNSESIHIVPNIEEATRIIRPPNAEEYPYTPYEFVDREELNDYFSRANATSLDELYSTAKGFYKKYVDQDSNIIVILSADSILTSFQDLFPIICYSEGIGGNDVDKSSIGYTFEYTGYRVIRGTSISGANYFRILGNIEPGQCTIIEDEADSISEDPDKVRILKAGYEFNAKIPKTNMNTQKQEQNWYYPYCYKMILAEKSLSEWKAKGLSDRTFSFKCRPDRVRYSIKRVVSETINKSPQLQALYDELLDFRKLMLCYRLVHYEDQLQQIKLNVINRDEELSYPLLQLFYGTEPFSEIKEAVEFFLKQRRQKRSRSLEAALYPILKELILANKDLTSSRVDIQYSKIWDKITSEKAIKGNLYSATEYETLEYGSLYQNSLSKVIGDKFSANLEHKEEGSVLTFDKEKFESYDQVYNHKDKESEVKIEVELVKDPDGTEGMTALEGASDNSERENKDKNTHTPPEAVRAVRPSASIEFPPGCYYCDFSIYETKEDYEFHCVLRHKGKPAYPGPADIQALNLISQDMQWEK